jgi:uncharacterized protein YqeY
MTCPLADKIQKDMVSAMKTKDELRLGALRMLKTSMQLASSEKGRAGDLTEDDIQALVRRGVKQREEAAELYKKGGAEDRARKELEEARVLSEYLPAQLDDAALKEIVSGVIASLGASTPKDIGRVMSGAMKEVSGRADGKRIKEIARQILN